MLLLISAYISFVAIDLCPALVLSLAAVVHCAIRALLSGHHPISAIPSHFGLMRVHLSSWFLISYISIHLFFQSLGVVSVHGHAQHLATILMGLTMDSFVFVALRDMAFDEVYL